MTLVCIETPDQIAAARTITAGHRIVALTPHAEYALTRASVALRRPEDYYEEEELHRLGVEELESGSMESAPRWTSTSGLTRPSIANTT